MNTSGKNAFINQLFVYVLVGVCLSGSAGLGAVWLRHQISITANHTRRLEVRLAEAERRLAEVTTYVAAEQSPDALERRNREMRLGLVMPREPQVVRVAESPERRLAARRNADLFADEPAATPVRFTLTGGARQRQ
ncbi:MAG: hypothetical protein ABII82_08675 [Verrucomicrobiota bacterium]